MGAANSTEKDIQEATSGTSNKYMEPKTKVTADAGKAKTGSKDKKKAMSKQDMLAVARAPPLLCLHVQITSLCLSCALLRCNCAHHRTQERRQTHRTRHLVAAAAAPVYCPESHDLSGVNDASAGAEATPDGEKRLRDMALNDMERNARPLTKAEFAQHAEGVDKAHEGAPVNFKQAKKVGPTNKGNNRDMRTKQGVQQPKGQNH
jgi:hypothetical protein